MLEKIFIQSTNPLEIMVEQLPNGNYILECGIDAETIYEKISIER
jgi:methenyltetrahydromethanopterin cyclohydrolase